MPEDRVSPLHRRILRTAIDNAFGPLPIDSIVSIGGGASGAFPFCVEIDSGRYLVRVEGPASPLRNPHQYKSMRMASESGIAPKIYHIDEAARVAVMDFIEEKPLQSFPGGSHALAGAVGEILSRMQVTPPFPHFVEYPHIVDRLWTWVCKTGLFAPGTLDPYTAHLERLRETYAWDSSKSVSSHNDPVPRNILFDGTRLWLIDWESAYRSDPLVDVSIGLDCFAPSPELEQIFLQAWRGRDLEASLCVRLVQVRALTRLYYAGVLLSAAATALGPLSDQDISAPTVSEFLQAVSNGQIKPGVPNTKYILGKMYLMSFLTGEPPPGLDAAV